MNLEHLSILYPVMVRAGREQATADVRVGAAVSRPRVLARAADALSIAGQISPRLAASIEDHYVELRRTFLESYQSTVRAMIQGEVAL